MPPLEMSLKACNIPFPMDPIHRVPPKSHVHNHEDFKMFFEPSLFRASWSSRKGYFPFTHPKSKEIVVPAAAAAARREVTFMSVVTIHSVLHLRDYTPEEVNDSWYSKREIRAMKQQCKHEAIQVNTNTAFENEQVTTNSSSNPGPLMDSTNHVNNNAQYHGGEPSSTMRGLESKTSMGSLRKKRHRIQAWKAVFLEQRRQHLEGCYDPETLADVYFEVSEPCHVAANMVAMRDARDAQFQYMEESRNPVESVFEKENHPNIPLTLENVPPPPPPPLVGGRYRTLIALHNQRIRREQRPLTVEVA